MVSITSSNSVKIRNSGSQWSVTPTSTSRVHVGTWSRSILWLQMSLSFMVLGHQQSQWWLLSYTGFRIIPLAYMSYNYLLDWMTSFNSMWPGDFIWHHICFNIGSGIGLLTDGTKPLPELMLTYCQNCPLTFIWGQFHKRYHSNQLLKLIWKLLI